MPIKLQEIWHMYVGARKGNLGVMIFRDFRFPKQGLELDQIKFLSSVTCQE